MQVEEGEVAYNMGLCSFNQFLDVIGRIRTDNFLKQVLKPQRRIGNLHN